jgi:hypothetical protein
VFSLVVGEPTKFNKESSVVIAASKVPPENVILSPLASIVKVFKTSSVKSLASTPFDVNHAFFLAKFNVGSAPAVG